MICALACNVSAASQSAEEDAYTRSRTALIMEIEADVRETADSFGRAALDERVITVLSTVPRHAFVPVRERPFAYENRPLPIGFGQTISQPYIVAIMTDLLDPKPGDNVLEVGTGSGYQAAVLSRLVAQVYSIEIVEPLAISAKQRLAELGYDNVSVRHGDGYYGWEEHGPFDAIVVTAAAGHVPPPLIAQLKPGGRMVIPVGSRFLTQQLVLITKQMDGSIITRQLLPVVFVPLTGRH
ncbi:MAG: protein-L-isoaspartate(D-aspartate) O-methyltransferase [Gammaproteobacteria bacterium]|nr:protein-L-isoaspartate(D-aspartate) O-methyltransferase [Gammaproteobacteria bacterium]MBU2479168.1 protein-L-isoaspartate(D-aspartate) O-methyltransferase [Gammaproteobacteria bacterium]